MEGEEGRKGRRITAPVSPFDGWPMYSIQLLYAIALSSVSCCSSRWV